MPTGFPKTAKNIKNALFYDYTCITDPKPTPRISAGNVFALYLQSIILFVCDKPMASSLPGLHYLHHSAIFPTRKLLLIIVLRNYVLMTFII